MTDEFEDILSELGIDEAEYTIVEEAKSSPTDLESPIHEIELLGGSPYAGLKIRYGKVSLTPSGDPDSGEGSATMSFDYEVTNVDEDRAKSLEDSEYFQKYVGKLLHYIIVKSFQTGDYKIGGSDTTDSGAPDSDDNTEESSS